MPIIVTVIFDTDNYTGAKQFSLLRDKIQLGMIIIITHNINNQNITDTDNNHSDNLPGVDVTAVSADGTTALAVACLEGHLNTAQLLYQNGAQLDLGDHKLLKQASWKGQIEVIQWLLDRGQFVQK